MGLRTANISICFATIFLMVALPVRPASAFSFASLIPGSVGDLLDDLGFGDTVGGSNFLGKTGNLWQNEILPSLQSMGKQLHTALLDQSRTEGSLHDADNEVQAIATLAMQEKKAIDRHRLKETTCQAYTAGSGLARAVAIGEQAQKALLKESVDIWTNSKNNRGNGGVANVLRDRWKVYEEISCDPEGNRGKPGEKCVGKPEYKNADIDIGKWLLARKSLDLSDEDLQKVVDAMLHHLAGGFPYDPIPPGGFDSPEGIAVWQARRDYIARRQAIMNTFSAMVARRTLGTELGEWIQKLREASGILPEEINPNPSYNEIMHVMAKERYWNPEYFIRLSKAEEEIIKEQAVVSTFITLIRNDLAELQEQKNALLAIRSSLTQNSNVGRNEGLETNLPVLQGP